MSTTERKVVWSIAGSDSGGGAGIQADLATMNGLGVHGCSVITAITAQNTQSVSHIAHTAPETVDAQLAALADDLPPDAVKIGMLGTAGIIHILAARLIGMNAPVVCDPVLAATSGDALLATEALAPLVDRIFPLVKLLTPNIPEAERLLARRIVTADDMESAATALLALGPSAVLLKGGHQDNRFSQDYWTDGIQGWWFTSPRSSATHTHGTGCTLSSAIASALALGCGMLDAIVIAKAYVNQGVRRGGGVGHGRGPLFHGPWPASPQDMPWMSRTAAEGRRCLVFADCGPSPLGIYPVVDRATWIERLLPLGVTTIQLRAKDLSGDALDREVGRAVALARTFNARLFINDDWRLALKHNAYGVHLGQEDLKPADLESIARAGLRLGVSAYSYADTALACGIRPSYIALGALFPTGSKEVTQPPLGIELFQTLRRLIAQPVVAIGGITLDRAIEVTAAGADGIAVISDILNAQNPEARTRAWVELIGTTR